MEGNFTECLGIRMEHGDNRTICMTQKGPIKKIIATAKKKECKPNKTPALTATLGSDAKGKPWDQNHRDCASIVRMLLCALNTPDQKSRLQQVKSLNTLHVQKNHMQEQSSASCVVLQEPQTKESL